MIDRQFCLDMAAAHRKSTTAQNKAHAAAYEALAARLAPVPPVVVPPVVVPPVAAGRPFAATSPWNTPTPAGTKWFDHQLLHTISPPINGDSRRHWYVSHEAMHVWHATASDPLCTFNMPQFVDTRFGRNRPAESFQFRCPASALPGGDSDQMLFVVDDTTGEYVEIWLAQRAGNVISAPGGGWARGNLRTGTGVGTPTQNAGVRAANFSWAGGLITQEDVAANRIDHALVLSLGYGLLSNTLHRAPATAPDNGGHDGPIAMGSRLGIPAGVAQPGGLSPLGVAMFAALQTYGAFVGDFAGTPYPMFYSDGGGDAIGRLFVWWDGYTPDMDLLGPLVRVADYQP